MSEPIVIYTQSIDWAAFYAELDRVKQEMAAERFDAIVIDDGVSYMTSREDLARLFRAAYGHLELGGVMIVSPDKTKEMEKAAEKQDEIKDERSK